jgi:hypothetical protein
MAGRSKHKDLRKEKTRHEEDNFGSCFGTYGCRGSASNLDGRGIGQHRLG